MAMEQVLTQPLTAARSLEAIAERLLRCAEIEEALGRALETGPPHGVDPALAIPMRQHGRRDLRHADALRALVREEDLPRRSGDRHVDPDLRRWLEQLSGAHGETEALAGAYGVAKVLLADAYRELLAAIDPARNRRVVLLLEELLGEEEADIEWGVEALRHRAADPRTREAADDWAEFLRRGLRAAGDIWGDMPRSEPPRWKGCRGA